MNKFNLKKALKGAKLITKNCEEVKAFGRNTGDLLEVYPYCAIVGSTMYTYTEQGTAFAHGNTVVDLFMAKNTVKRSIKPACIGNTDIIGIKRIMKGYSDYDYFGSIVQVASVPDLYTAILYKYSDKRQGGWDSKQWSHKADIAQSMYTVNRQIKFYKFETEYDLLVWMSKQIKKKR